MDVKSRAIMHLLVFFGGTIAVGEEGVRDYESPANKCTVVAYPGKTLVLHRSHHTKVNWDQTLGYSHLSCGVNEGR